jgi:hypothetical protein
LSLSVMLIPYTVIEAADLSFTEITAEASGLTHVVVARSEEHPESIKYPWMSPMVDINGDNNLDIMYYGHHGGGAAIWLGKGDGTFTLDSTNYMNRWVFGTRAPLWWHIDSDNFIDGVSSQSFPGGVIYMSDGKGKWTKTGAEILPARTWYPKLIDADGDGHHCEFAVKGGAHTVTPSMNTWAEKFPSKTETKKLWNIEEIISWPEGVEHSRGTGFAVSYSADLDGDHVNEVFVHFSEGFITGKNFRSYVLNLDAKTKKWSDSNAERGLPREGAFFPEDWDCDGDLDILDIHFGVWYVNDGTGKFTKSDQPLFDFEQKEKKRKNGYYVGDNSVDMLDLNNDGRRDLCISGHHSPNGAYILNLGDGKVKELYRKMTVWTMARAIGDVDGDGDLDYVTKGKKNQPTMKLFRNDTTMHGLFIRIFPKNIPEQQLGCKIWVYEEGKMGDAKALINYRQHFMENPASKAQVIDGNVHVGIGTRSAVDVRVRFPSGVIRELKSLKPATTTKVVE